MSEREVTKRAWYDASFEYGGESYSVRDCKTFDEAQERLAGWLLRDFRQGRLSWFGMFAFLHSERAGLRKAKRRRRKGGGAE